MTNNNNKLNKLKVTHQVTIASLLPLNMFPLSYRWDAFAAQNGVPCYDSDMPPEWERCFTPLAAWAVGSKGENLPDHVGLPLAANKASYYMLEVHFDNPHMKKAVGTTGFRVHYTHR